MLSDATPWRWLAERAVRLALLLVAVALGCFALIELSPLDPVNAYIGADVVRVGPEQRALIAERWGLDDPLPVRFANFIGQLAQGNLGTSMIYNAPVASVIVNRFANSLALLSIAWLLSGVLGFALGMLAASRPGSAVDRGVRWTAFTLASAPTFWVGLVLLSTFSVALGVTPVSGAFPVGADPDQVGLLTRLHHLVLPAATLSIVGIAPIALHTREQAAQIMRSEFVTFARAQGEHGRGLLRRRVLRNAAVPALMLQFASLSELFGGAILAEAVFNFPGLGQATVAAGVRGDVPLLVGIALFSAVFVFVGNALGDVAQGLADPRVPVFGRHRRAADRAGHHAHAVTAAPVATAHGQDQEGPR